VVALSLLVPVLPIFVLKLLPLLVVFNVLFPNHGEILEVFPVVLVEFFVVSINLKI
jgi:hypothetical protein